MIPTNPSLTGSKRKISIKVFPVPKHDDTKKFTKFLSSHDISFSKVKKVHGMVSANITFDTEEQQEEAKTKLATIELAGQTLQFKNHEDEVEQKNQRRESHFSKHKVQLPDCVEDVVTPWHKMPYEEQLTKKTSEMQQILMNVTTQVHKASFHAPLEWTKTKKFQMCCEFEGVKPSPLIEGYRNKVELSVGQDINGKPTIGFLLGGVRDGIVAIGSPMNCKNVSARAKEVIVFFQTFIEENPLYSVWDKSNSTGFVRLLTIKTNEDKQAMATIQINPAALTREQIDVFKQLLIQKVVDSSETAQKIVDSLHVQEYGGISNAAPYDCAVDYLYGETHIYESLFDLKFRISPTSFFQTNTKATEILYSIAKDWAGAMSAETTTLLDICCGTGTIGMTMSNGVQNVIGIEMIESAISDAHFNAELNKLTNCTFVLGKAEDKMKEVVSAHRLWERKAGECVAIVDPPRSGLHHDTLYAIRKCSAITRLVYIACNPLSLVDNATALCRPTSRKVEGLPFVPVKSVAVDLFPHTPHCELVMLFERPAKVEEKEKTKEEENVQHGEADNNSSLTLDTVNNNNINNTNNNNTTNLGDESLGMDVEFKTAVIKKDEIL
jgi:tRNA (uracil-5-)-methyltransferase